MIGRLAGRIVECRPGRVLLDVGGVGYELQVPLGTYYALAGDERDSVVLHVHTHVREDALQLYGFVTQDERGAFERLISVSGIGPRLALAILSGIGVDEFRVAVLQQDLGRLQQIPGVGRKTAERVLLELRDKLVKDEERAAAGPSSSTAGAADPSADAVSALVNLGFARDVARKAVSGAMERRGSGVPTLDRLLREALTGLVR